jgi:hypothetical protein
MTEKNYLWKEGESAKDFATRLQSELDEYKKKVLDLKTIEDAELEEKACIEDAEKYEKYIAQTAYELKNDVTYDGSHYTKREIATMIMYFIGKQEVKWDFTLGLYELYKLWKNDVNVLTFRQLDSTLRVLDQCQFKGFKEWKDILAINEYFKSNHEQFSIDTAGTIYLAQRHNAVMDQMELLKTINGSNSVKEKEPVEPVAKVEKKKK